MTAEIADCFGPYLRYAITTKFRDFKNRLNYCEKANSQLFLLVEFKEGVDWQDFVDAMKAIHFKITLGPKTPTEPNSRYATARCDSKAVTCNSAVGVWETFAWRVELSLPMDEVAPNRGGGTIEKRGPHRHRRKAPSVLIGVLDDGCPFAADRFLEADHAMGTRVLAIWDQKYRGGPVSCKDRQGKDCVFGQQLKDFVYGFEFLRNPPPPARGKPRQIGLNEWIDLHRTPTGGIDEDGCYADADFQTLSYRDSHGAHVMDVLAGRIPTSSRISLDRVQPPTFAPATGPASQADIVFVQFPKNCIQDPSGVWLDAYIVDSIRYVLSYAGPTFDKVVINISYGQNTGPHNGTALLEQALTALVEEFNAAFDKPKLQIVLASGNYYLTDSHVLFGGDEDEGDDEGEDEEETVCHEWTWRLPPDNAALCFAEVWLKNADADGVTVTLTSPSGVVFTSTDSSSPAGVEGPIEWGGDDKVWRLQVEHTVIGTRIPDTSDMPDVVAEYGDYTITVSGVPPKAKLHGYVALTDPNLDAPPGARPSFFVDLDLEGTLAASDGCNYADGEFANSESFVDRFGTLNGIATAETKNVHVAGGFMLAHPRRKSPYASAGPARRGPLPFREGPDFAMLCDESYALEGIPGGGNRSCVVFRLIGTSAAAPQLARWIVDGGLPGATAPPTDLEGIEQRGCGNLTPP